MANHMSRIYGYGNEFSITIFQRSGGIHKFGESLKAYLLTRLHTCALLEGQTGRWEGKQAGRQADVRAGEEAGKERWTDKRAFSGLTGSIFTFRRWHTHQHTHTHTHKHIQAVA